MSDFYFKSVFANYFESFYEEQVALGKNAHMKMIQLNVIDKYFYHKKIESTFVTEDVFNTMMEYLTKEEGRNYYRYAATFSQFMRYMVRLGNPAYIPRIPRFQKHYYISYIFTHDEITKIFNAADSIRVRKHHNKCILIIMPALLRMLYSTAMRIGEALALVNEDVDFEHHTILIKNSKNKSQRIAPINNTLETVLKQYVAYRNRIPVNGINNPKSPFFVNLLGKPCLQHTVFNRFVEILQKANIPYKGNKHGPRIHDLRHTACIHAMEKMISDGKDIYCTMPYIAAFMGHKNLDSTNYYLRLTKQMYPKLLTASESVSQMYNTILSNIEFEEYEE